MNLRFEAEFGNSGFTQIEPPVNYQGLRINVLFLGQNPSATIEGTDFEWVGDMAVKLNQWKAQGRIHECPGIRIYAETANGNVQIFSGMIKTADSRTHWECDKVVAPCQPDYKADTVQELLGAVTFGYLASLQTGKPGKITPSIHYKKVPYCISEIPDYTQAAILSISQFIMLKELYDAVCKFASFIEELIGDTTTAVATVGLASGTLIATIARVVLYVTYITLVIIAIIDMAKQIIDNIIQKKKYKLAMREQDCFERICNFLGLTFYSTIYAQSSPFYNATWMPSKTVIPDMSNPLQLFERPEDESIGFPTNSKVYGHPDETCTDFITEMCSKYNAEVTIVNGVLYFEEKHSWNINSAYQIPNVGTVGNTFNLPDPHKTNAAELPWNYGIFFSRDGMDNLTNHRYKGTSVTVTISPTQVQNAKRIVRGKGVQIQLRQALAKRKQYLTRVENVLNNVLNALANFVNFFINSINSIINAINTAISFFGGNPATIGTIPPLPTNIFNNRIGWMECTDDSFGVPKAFIGQQSGSDWVLHPNSENVMNATYLLQQFHGKNLPTRGAQQRIYENHTFPMCAADFQQILNKNIIVDPAGLPGKLIKLEWDPWKEIAENVEYGVLYNNTTYLSETIISDGG